MSTIRNTGTPAPGSTGPLKPTAPSALPQPGAAAPGNAASQKAARDAARTAQQAAARLKALGRFNALPERIRDLDSRIQSAQRAVGRDESALKSLQNALARGFRLGAGRAPVNTKSVATRLQSQIADQKKSIQGLQAERKVILAEKADDTPDGKVDAGHQKVLAEIGKLDGQIGKAQSDKLAGESKLESLLNKKVEEFGKSSGLQITQIRLKDSIADQKKAIEKARKDIASLGENSGQLRKQNAGFEAENKKLFTQEQAKGAERRKLLGEQAADRPLYDALKALEPASLADGDKTFIAAYDKRAGAITGLTNDITQLNQKQDANQASIVKNQQTLRDNDTKVNGLNASIKAAEGDIKGLEGQLSNVNTRLAELDKAGKALDGQIAAQTAEVKKLGDQLTGLQDQRKTAVRQARGTEVQDVRLGEAQVERLDKEIGTVKGQLDTAKSKLTDLVSRRDQVKSDADRLGKEVGALKAAIDGLKAEMAGARKSLEGNEKSIGNLVAENAKLFAQEQGLGKERQGLLRQIAEEGPLADALKSLDPEVLTEDDKKFIESFDAAGARVKAIGSEVASLNEKQSANDGKIGELRTANEGLQKRIQDLEASIKSDSGKLAGLEKSLQEANGKIAGLDKEIATAQKGIDQLQQKLSGLESERGKWLAELEQDKSELAALK